MSTVVYGSLTFRTHRFGIAEVLVFLIDACLNSVKLIRIAVLLNLDMTILEPYSAHIIVARGFERME